MTFFLNKNIWDLSFSFLTLTLYIPFEYLDQFDVYFRSDFAEDKTPKSQRLWIQSSPCWHCNVLHWRTSRPKTCSVKYFGVMRFVLLEITVHYFTVQFHKFKNTKAAAFCFSLGPCGYIPQISCQVLVYQNVNFLALAREVEKM